MVLMLRDLRDIFIGIASYVIFQGHGLQEQFVYEFAMFLIINSSRNDVADRLPLRQSVWPDSDRNTADCNIAQTLIFV